MKTYGMSLFYLTVFTFSLLAGPTLNLRKDQKNSAYPMPNVLHVTEAVTPKGDCSSNNSMNFSTTNANNQRTTPSLGKTATIVSPSITFHKESIVKGVKETPAHIGFRHEKKTVHHFNKKTKKVERKTFNSKVPIHGKIRETVDLKARHTRKYDLNSHNMGPVSTTISEI